jgi:hypothetical protein
MASLLDHPAFIDRPCVHDRSCGHAIRLIQIKTADPATIRPDQGRDRSWRKARRPRLNVV